MSHALLSPKWFGAQVRCPSARQRSMMPSSRRIDDSQAWCDSIRSRPARASRCRSSGSSRMRRIACDVFVGRRGHEKCSPVHGVHAARRDAARHHRHAHRHRLEDLVLGAARDVERRDHQRRAPDVRPHVGNGARDGHARQLAEPLHRRRRIGADDQQLQLRAAAPAAAAGVGAEVEHALLVGVVVHAPDEADRVGVVGLVRRREVVVCPRRSETSRSRTPVPIAIAAFPTRRASSRCTGRSGRRAASPRARAFSPSSQ